MIGFPTLFPLYWGVSIAWWNLFYEEENFSGSVYQGLKRSANERSVFSHSQPPSQSRAHRHPAKLSHSILPSGHTCCRECYFIDFTMELLSDNSSRSSEHEAETSVKPRKRQRCPEKWIRGKIKQKSNRGEAYTSHTSKNFMCLLWFGILSGLKKITVKKNSIVIKKK